MNVARTGWLALALLLGVMGCKNPGSRHSAIFNNIFGETEANAPDSLIFRKAYFGEPMNEIAKHESGDPVYNDFFGLEFDLPSISGEVVHVMYYQNPMNKDGLASIHIEADLPDEFQAVGLYREIEEYLNLRYGPPKGWQGNYSWESEEKDTQAYLSLTDSKKRILLNFLPINWFNPPIEMTDSLFNQPMNP